MKTNQEILNFYNVKIGRKYRITSHNSDPATDLHDVKFTIKMGKSTANRPVITFPNNKNQYVIHTLADYTYEEVEILDKEEKEYLGNIIKPFRKKVYGITKVTFDDEANIVIHMTDETNIWLPAFKKDKMYRGMEENKLYTLEELDL